MKFIQRISFEGRVLAVVLPSVVCMFYYAAQLSGQIESHWPLVLSFIVLLSTAGFVYIAFSDSIRQLTAINSTMEKLNWDNDLNSRVDIISEDSIGGSAKELNRLLDNLTTIFEKYKESTSEIAATTQDLCGVSVSSDQSFDNQHGEMEQFVYSVTELTSMIHHIADNTRIAAEATEVARSHTQSGALVATNAMCAIEAVFNDLSNADEAIEVLNEKAHDVELVLEVIGNISEQTNLLALNAAIEAARAGEQGRGFAVVADEVRNLACKTQDSICEIQQIIDQLQEGARLAVKRMGQARSQANDGVEQMEESAESLGTIAGEVATLVDMNNRIAEAARHQDELANTLNIGIDNIKSLVENSKSEAEMREQYSDKLFNLVTGISGYSEFGLEKG